MTDGVRAGGFTAANAAEKQRQAELAQKLAADARQAKQTGEEAWAGQVANQRTALEDDTVVSSAAVKELGEAGGWDQKRMQDALARHDQNHDAVFSEDEFDALSAEMEPGKPEGYTVEAGDSLSGLTEATGRDASRYQELYEHNKKVIGADPNMIHPGQALEKPPTWVVEDAKIDPAKPTHQVPDRLEEMLKRAKVDDAETLGQAKQALGEIPAGHPKRAEYEQKVQALEKAFEKKWAPPAEPATPPAGGAEPPADDPAATPPAEEAAPPAEPPVDPQVKADYEQMLEDPGATSGWDAARKGAVQEHAQQEVEAKLKEAEDASKTPEERLAAAEEAEQIASEAIAAAERAGHHDLASGLGDESAKAQDATQRLKIATGDREVVEQAIDDAGTDKAKLKAIAEALPKDDPRAKALMAVADGKVADDVAEKILHALEDQDSTRGDFAEALQRCDGDKAAIEALAAVAEYKAGSQDDAGAKAEMEALAASLNAMAKAGDAVRAELAKGFDDRGNLGDYERAVDAAASKEDLEAIKAFVDHKKVSEEGTGADTFGDTDYGPRLQAAIDNFDALKGDPEVMKQIKHLMRDDRDNKDDLIGAGTASGDPATLRALAKVAEAVGEFDVAANLLELTDPKYKDAAAGTRESILERD